MAGGLQVLSAVGGGDGPPQRRITALAVQDPTHVLVTQTGIHRGSDEPWSDGLYRVDLTTGDWSALVLAERASLGELTVCLGQSESRAGWFRALRNLNPRLDPESRLSAGTELLVPSGLAASYVEHCVGDSPRLALARRLHDGANPTARQMMQHTVRSGETLASIAERYGCRSVRRLADYNGIVPPDYPIHVGQRILVPACG